MKKTMRTVATMLMMVLLLQMLPSGLGSSSSAQAGSPSPSGTLLPRDKWVEDESLRSVYARQYKAGDYMVAEVSATPIHYKDKNGRWQPIQTGLSQDAGGDYIGDLGNFKVHFSAKAQGNQLRYDLPGGTSVVMGVDETDDSQGQGGGHKATFQPAAEANKMHYKDRDGRMDYDYEASSTGVKELITLHKYTGKTEWVFPVSLNGVELRDAGDGGYALVDKATGETRATIPPAFAEDADGNRAPSVQLTAVDSAGGPALRLSVDRDWLAATERKFPVTIDPSLVSAPQSADLLYGTIGTSFSGAGGLTVENDMLYQAHGLVRFDLSGVPRGAFIQSAIFSATATSSNGHASQTIGIYEVTQAWNTNFTWTSPMGSGTTWPAGGAVGSTNYGQLLPTNAVNLTNLVQSWVNGTKGNYGVLAQKDYDTYSGNTSWNLTNPTLQVVYAFDVLSPTVSLSGIAAGASVSAPVTVTATAVDTAPGGIGQVHVLVDSSVVGTKTNPASSATTFTVDPRQFAAGQHTLTAVAYDFAGNRAVSAPISFFTTVTEEPRSLTVQPTATGATLSWTVPASGAETYNVYRSLSPTMTPGVSDRLATGITGTTYVDNSLTGSKAEAYSYAVTAVKAGVESRPALATASFPFAPGQPTYNPSTKLLTWLASSRTGVTYNVYRADSNSNQGFTRITTGLTGLQYTDSPPISATANWIYQVTAVDGPNESSRSPVSVNSASSSLPGSDLKAQDLGLGSVLLTWTPGGQVSIGRAIDDQYWDGITYSWGLSTSGGSYVDSGLTGGQIYVYRVCGGTCSSSRAAVTVTGGPLPVSNLSAQPATDPNATGQTNLTWTPSGSPGVSYSVYRTQVAKNPAAPPPIFTRSSNAYKLDGTQVAANVPRFEAGKYGQSVGIEEGTSNLLSLNQSNVETDTSGFALGWASDTMQRDTTRAWQGMASLKVTLLPASGVDYVQTSGGIGCLAPNTVYTASAYIWADPGVGVSLYIQALGFGLGSTTVTGNGTWQRATLTFTTGSSICNSWISVYNSSGAPTTFWLDGLQLEAKGFASRWIPGGTTQARETLSVPTTGILSPVAGTWEQWVLVSSASKQHDQGRVFDINNSANTWGIALWYSGGSWFVESQKEWGGVNSAGSASAQYTPDGWHHFAVTWTPSALKLYIDGVVRSSITNPSLPTAFGSAYVGSDRTGAYSLNTVHDDVRISTVARTASEVAADYSSVVPLPADVSTLCKFNLENNLVLLSSPTIFSDADRIASGLTSGLFTDPANLVANSGFDQDQDNNGVPDQWSAAARGGTIDTTTAEYGTASAKFVRGTGDLPYTQSLSQTVLLRQASAAPVTLSAWSKAAGVVGGAAGDYAATVTLQDAGGSTVGTQTLSFSAGAHDWEYHAATLTPTTAAQTAIVTIQLNGAATGTAWFDGIQLQPGTAATNWVEGPVLPGESYLYDVATVPPSGPAAFLVAPQVTGQPWTLVPPNGDPPGLGLDSRWAFANLPMPGGTAYVNLNTGNLVFTATDSVVPGPKLAQVFRRTYNSQASAASGPLGAQGWNINVIQTLTRDVSTGDVTLTEGDGTRLRFTHNADGTYTAPPSVWMTFQPDTGTYAWKITRRDGMVYEFDGSGRMLLLSESNGNVNGNANGNAIVYSYDANGRLAAVSGPATRQATIDYDGAGRIQAIHDAAGRTSAYAYDSNGRLLSMTDPLQLAVTYTYDANGRLSAVTDAAGRSVNLTYDGAGRVATYGWQGITGTTQFAYSQVQGLLQTTVTDPLNHSSRYVTNRTGNLMAVYDAKGGLTSYQYDTNERMIKMVTSRGLVTSIAYEGDTPRILTVTHWTPDQVVTTYSQYSPYDQPRLVVDAMGTQALFEYDGAGNLLKRTD
ncbi:MAG TPA: LamG-like jellyroll fold domain-containing protein [Symbiobacteriaceae bacterium]|jgi:YD repeat-containing protein